MRRIRMLCSARYFARPTEIWCRHDETGVHVTAVNVSPEQIKAARVHAKAAGRSARWSMSAWDISTNQLVAAGLTSAPNSSNERGEHSETEAQPHCGIDVVTLEIAIGQSTRHLRKHDTSVEVPLRCKAPINREGNAIECPGAL